MKAMILAAGFGTRLLPYTGFRPKALFTIADQPILDLMIRQLVAAGCRAIVVNTHHLHDQIEAFVARSKYTIPVQTRFEAVIRGTGGAVKNVSDFWDNQPFMVVNSDIVTDIDLEAVYRFHRQHPQPVTLVLHDAPAFNTVAVDSEDLVTGFGEPGTSADLPNDRLLAFTGIQVLDPEVLELVPPASFHSSIDTYRTLIAEGRGVKAFIVTDHYWTDIGTPERYRQAVYDKMTPRAFAHVLQDRPPGPIECELLAGDGSDRLWYRLKSGPSSLILADHGIRTDTRTAEVDAFVAIGRHLRAAGIDVPQIYLSDRFAGLVYLEDIGDEHLQETIRRTSRSKELVAHYRPIIRQLVAMAFTGAKNFDPAWAYQTPSYSRELILEKECRYFVEAFLKTYLGRSVSFADLAGEFDRLADRALAFGINGFMHRDFQSRNIMLRNGTTVIIDFQGGRLGPVQYDLASLLIDPYVDLPQIVEDQLLAYCLQQIDLTRPVDPNRFHKGYHYCCLTRNLQILGAFGHLSKVKGKTQFEAYIPTAVRHLHQRLNRDGENEFPQLNAIISDVIDGFRHK
ncbi:MAG: sugar phosphate nucleotidyltransferase [Desulfobacterales bacterium]|jgi:aminoglycoside/choline kinase family phosphotransferase/dTDP-glucose pyrophosphorylase